MNKKHASILCISSIAFYLSGCAFPAEPEGMMYHAEASEKATITSPYYKNIEVKTVVGGDETIPFLVSDVSNEDFKKALEESLKLANFGDITDKGKYSLEANLIDLDRPVMGIGMTVKSVVNYKLTDKTSHNTIIKETIDSNYTANFSDSIVGTKRLRLANEGAIKENIKKFIEKLNHQK